MSLSCNSVYLSMKPQLCESQVGHAVPVGQCRSGRYFAHYTWVKYITEPPKR